MKAMCHPLDEAALIATQHRPFAQFGYPRLT
jgi:hypothetical protein